MNKKESELEQYWTNRYEEQMTGWDIGYPSTPIKEYVDQLEDKNLKILIPGAGNGYEAEYLFNNGFKNTHVLDVSQLPLNSLKKRVPDFPKEQLIQQDFFEHVGKYDLILEQTFFCSFEPTMENREGYARQMYQLLVPSGKLVGLWFKHPLLQGAKRPFGGTQEEYVQYLSPYFMIKIFEDCYNSIKPRKGNELFGMFQKPNR